MANIYLIGMRGVGKTSIGKVLAQRLGRDFIDIDEQIALKEGKTIMEIVADQGWEEFRKRENAMVQEISKKENSVVSTGGGALMHFDNAQILKSSGKLFLLVATPAVLVERLKASHQRPSLNGKDPLEEIDEIWEQRKEIYYKYADEVVDTEPWDQERIMSELGLKTALAG